ncbi:MAG: RNA-binding S4 domain-containing protein [Bacteroidaceae bacterium]|nr:RNA-binding S4 domain-containing protein [Bacteroidaceae bacterium]
MEEKDNTLEPMESGANENEQRQTRRPRFTRPVDGDRPQRPRFVRDGENTRYQRVERTPRPYQPRYNNEEEGAQGERRNFERPYRSYQPRYYNEQQGERPYRPRYNRDEQQAEQPRPYRPRNNQEGQMNENRPYRPHYNNYEEQAPRYHRPYQPRYEQGNSWEGQQEEGYRPQPRRPYQGENNGYRPRGYNNGNYRQNAPFGRAPKKSFSEKYNKKKQILYREELTDPNEPIRLNKYLANAGVCSRREADEFILAGVVSVNGQVITELGTKVKRSDEVRFHDQLVNIERKIYLLLNKPKDYVTTVEDPQDRKTVMDLVKGACKERIYPVGRLDRNTTGVLLFTNDGEMASKLTHPSFRKKKVYHVRVDKPLTAEDFEKLLSGIELEDGEIKVDAINFTPTDTDHTQVGIEIHSGRNRIVRRMFEALGYHVVRLDRTQFAGLTKKNLRRGDWRFLTEKEVNMLRMGAYE